MPFLHSLDIFRPRFPFSGVVGNIFLFLKFEDETLKIIVDIFRFCVQVGLVGFLRCIQRFLHFDLSGERFSFL